MQRWQCLRILVNTFDLEIEKIINKCAKGKENFNIQVLAVTFLIDGQGIRIDPLSGEVLSPMVFGGKMQIPVPGTW